MRIPTSSLRHPSRHFNTVRIAPYLFTAPFFVSLVLFFFYPMLHMFQMSFQRIEGISDTTFVGIDNYRRLLTDTHVRMALLNSVSFTVCVVVVNVILAVLLAVMLNNRLTPLRKAFRSALYLPALTSIIVAGIFFRLFFGSGEATPLNQLMGLLNLEPRKWLYDIMPTGILVLVITSTWRWLGTNIIYFLCGLQSIPEELYEAADIDGAGPLQRLLYITIPSLKPMLIFVITVTTYGGLRMFGESFVLWTNGSTPGDIGLTIVLYIYKTAFTRFDTGYASAMSVALMILLVIINLFYIKGMSIGKREGA